MTSIGASLLAATDVRQSRLLLARRLALIGLCPEYVDLLAARLDARPAADVLAAAAHAPPDRLRPFDAVWCVEQPAATAAPLLPLAAAGGRRTAFHLVTVGDAGTAGRTVAAAAVRGRFPAGVHCLAPTVSDLADHPELPRPAFTRLAVAETTRPTPPVSATPGSTGPGSTAPAAVNLLPLAPAARALAEAAEQPGWSGLRHIGWVHARPTEAAALVRAVGPEPALRMLRRLSGMQPAAATTELDLPPVGARYLSRATAPALSAVRLPERV